MTLWEQAIFNLEIKKKSGLSINPDIHHSKVSSSGHIKISSKILYKDIRDILYKDFQNILCKDIQDKLYKDFQNILITRIYYIKILIIHWMNIFMIHWIKISWIQNSLAPRAFISTFLSPTCFLIQSSRGKTCSLILEVLRNTDASTLMLTRVYKKNVRPQCGLRRSIDNLPLEA